MGWQGLLLTLVLTVTEADGGTGRKVLGERFGVTIDEPPGPWAPALPAEEGRMSASGETRRVTSTSLSYRAERLTVEGATLLKLATVKTPGQTAGRVTFTVTRGQVRAYLSYVDGLAYVTCEAAAPAACSLEGSWLQRAGGVRAVMFEALGGPAELSLVEASGPPGPR